MSQNKTIVPGVDYDNLGKTEFDDSLYGNLYSRSEVSDNRTYIPDVSKSAGSSSQEVIPQRGNSLGADEKSRQILLQNRVVVGVLFSISHGLLGEIFPLYLGRNIIGQTANCDILLKEKTVSSEHAILYIRKEGNPNSLSMTITDYNSMYGTTVNEMDAEYETLPVKENDILKIGKHYQFLVKVFNVEQANLTEDPGFEDIDEFSVNIEGAYNGEVGQNVSNDFYTPTPNKDNSSRTVLY